MPGQLIPLPEFAMSLPKSLTREQGVQLWIDHMESCEQLLLAGLRKAAGPNGDIKVLYRQWYQKAMDDHDHAQLHMLERFAAAQGTQ